MGLGTRSGGGVLVKLPKGRGEGLFVKERKGKTPSSSCGLLPGLGR